MPAVILYIATSLDGYIARPDGSVAWLSTYDRDDEDYGYAEFYGSIDALVMGSKTYEQVLGFGDWPYAGRPTYVLSRRDLEHQRGEVTIAPTRPDSLLQKLDAVGHKRVWLVGGAELAASFGKQGLIDEYIITIVPIVLGGGIPLFPSPGNEEQLELLKSKQYSSGLVQLQYGR
ncbi:MAG: dihydrofolate reductase family protein [Candidatus Neomarinimicrobiota bacterium]